MIEEIAIKLLPRLPRSLVFKFAKRYIAGEDADSVIGLAKKLQDSGFLTTIDLLKEEVQSTEQANKTTDDLIGLMTKMAGASIERNLSIKLTSLGLRISEDLAFDNLKRIIDAARNGDYFITIDMEDSSITDVTIDFYRRAKKIWPRVGIVLQSRLKRSVEDAKKLAHGGANIRVVKGIYVEPAAVAWQSANEINEAFLLTLEAVWRRGGYAAIATHDLDLLGRIEQEFEAELTQKDKAEFQALLGVPMGKTLNRLRDEGHRVRLYLPFGNDWWDYSLRRLRENPQLLRYIVKDLFLNGGI